MGRDLVALLLLAALALTHFQAGVALRDDVDIATALHNLAVGAALFHVADRANNFHDFLWVYTTMPMLIGPGER